MLYSNLLGFFTVHTVMLTSNVSEVSRSFDWAWGSFESLSQKSNTGKVAAAEAHAGSGIDR